VSSQLDRRFLDGDDDCRIRAAAADVTGQPLSDLFARGCGIMQKQRLGDRYLSRSAKAALRADVAQKRFLQRIQPIALGQPFDGQEFFSVRFAG
jgi:hypothetical protein